MLYSLNKYITATNLLAYNVKICNNALTTTYLTKYTKTYKYIKENGRNLRDYNFHLQIN